MMATLGTLGELIPCGGGDPIPLLKSKLLVGRRSHCDIQLRFPNISSQHCELEFVNGFWRVQDLNSSNGVKVNGERAESKWLMPGDTLAIGKHRYEVVYTTNGQRPPEEEQNPFARSLLEKAGLEHFGERPRRPPPAAPPPSSATPPAPTAAQKKKAARDEDEAMQWLSEL